MPPSQLTIALKYWNRVTNTYFGCTPIRLPTVWPSSWGPP